MIFDYAESHFTESRFCSKEAAATFTNGSYSPRAACLPSPLQQTRLAIKTRHSSKLNFDTLSDTLRKDFLGEKINRFRSNESVRDTRRGEIAREGFRKKGKKTPFHPRACSYVSICVYAYIRIIYKDKGQRLM